MRKVRFNLLFLALVPTLFLWRAPDVAAKDWMLTMKHDGLTIEGEAIHWSRNDFFILGRDGKLWEFENSEAPRAKKIKEPFSSYTQQELRASLQQEYGTLYDVSGTGHFLVVHPRGQRDVWAGRFEQLYREMIHYFTSRRIKVHDPELPLVAVVFATESEFTSHARKDGMKSNDVLGYYSTRSNRILLYDQTGGRYPNWRENALTIVHEAAHQTAFNIGLHNRFADTPRWLSEGLGTLFEAPGVNNGSKFRKLEDRINDAELATYLRYFPEELPAGTIKSLVASDKFFRSAPLKSYCVAWATTFTMAERQPLQLAEYLQVTARQRKTFMLADSPGSRLNDFQQAFGMDPDKMQDRVDDYIRSLK